MVSGAPKLTEMTPTSIDERKTSRIEYFICIKKIKEIIPALMPYTKRSTNFRECCFGDGQKLVEVKYYKGSSDKYECVSADGEGRKKHNYFVPRQTQRSSRKLANHRAQAN